MSRNRALAKVEEAACRGCHASDLVRISNHRAQVAEYGKQVAADLDVPSSVGDAEVRGDARSGLAAYPVSSYGKVHPCVRRAGSHVDRAVLLQAESVRRPTTAEGLTTNTLPKPLLVFMAAPRVPEQPPVHTPVVQLWPVEQSASLEHDVAHMPKCVVASIFTQVPPIAEQSASAAQVPALQVVPPVIWPLFLFSWQ